MNEDNLENKNTNENNEERTKTYTAEEVADMLQRESDRRVSEALKKAEKKNQEAIKEAERLAKMSEQERYEESLKKKEKELEEKEQKLALLENTAVASKALSDRGISVGLVDLVVAPEAEDMMANIKLLEDEFKKSVKAEVEKRLSGNNPQRNQDNGEMTREKFKTLSISEQTALINQNADYAKFL